MKGYDPSDPGNETQLTVVERTLGQGMTHNEDIEAIAANDGQQKCEKISEDFCIENHSPGMKGAEQGMEDVFSVIIQMVFSALPAVFESCNLFVFRS
jgi:hypothetical protein